MGKQKPRTSATHQNTSNEAVGYGSRHELIVDTKIADDDTEHWVGAAVVWIVGRLLQR